MHNSAQHQVLQRHGVCEEGGEFDTVIDGTASGTRPSASKKSLVRVAVRATGGSTATLVVLQVKKSTTVQKIRVRARESVAQRDVISFNGSTGTTTSVEVIYGGKRYNYAPVAVKTASETAAAIKALLEADGHAATEYTTALTMGGQPKTYLEVVNKTPNAPAALEVTVTAGNGTTACKYDEHVLLAKLVALAAGDNVLVDFVGADDAGYLDAVEGDAYRLDVVSENNAATAGRVAYSMAFIPPMDERRIVENGKHIDTEVSVRVPVSRTY